MHALMYIHKTSEICFIPITPFFTSPFLKSISLLKRFKVRRLPSSREFHFCCMASAFASLWSNNELLLAYGKKHISYQPCIVKWQNKPAYQRNSSLARWITMFSFNAFILFCICWHVSGSSVSPQNGLADASGTAHASSPYASYQALQDWHLVNPYWSFCQLYYFL